MKNVQHCHLCDHQVKNHQLGVICGITKEKAAFSNKCDKITLGERLFQRIEKFELEYELVRRTKNLTIANFIVFICLSFSFFAGGYWIAGKLYDLGYFHTGVLVVYGIGLLTLPLAFGPVRKYVSEIKVATERLSNLRKILNIYDLGYTSNVQIKNQNHGFVSAQFEITLQRADRPFQTYTNQFSYNKSEKEMSGYQFGKLKNV